MATITFRAWDQTTGVNGGIADASINGGTTAFSTASETASITVNPVNDAPVASDVSVTTDEGVAVNVTLPASDADGDSLIFSIVSGPSNGSLNGTPPTVTYTPNKGFFGPDSFTFKANDGQTDSNVGTVSITVLQVVIAPKVTTQPLSQTVPRRLPGQYISIKPKQSIGSSKRVPR